MKRSGVGDPTPEGSLTLVWNLLWGVVNRGLDILDNLTKLSITKYEAEVGKFLYFTNFKKNTQTIVKNLQKLFNIKIVH